MNLTQIFTRFYFSKKLCCNYRHYFLQNVHWWEDKVKWKIKLHCQDKSSLFFLVTIFEKKNYFEISQVLFNHTKLIWNVYIITYWRGGICNKGLHSWSRFVQDNMGRDCRRLPNRPRLRQGYISQVSLLGELGKFQEKFGTGLLSTTQEKSWIVLKLHCIACWTRSVWMRDLNWSWIFDRRYCV